MRFTICTVRRGVALAGALLVFATSAGWTQQQRGTIAGTVTDRVAATPLAGARISLLNTNLSTVTNQQGHYTLTNVPVGTYQVQVSIIGYGSATNTATVTESGIETVDFGLRPAAVSLDYPIVTRLPQVRKPVILRILVA